MRKHGFTLIELLVTLAIIGTLLSLAAPRYFGGVERAKEAVLKENLATMRDAIDKHWADTGRYPDTLEELVAKRYLKRIPVDPVTDTADEWVLLPPPSDALGSIYDVRSGAAGSARDGTQYADW